MTTAQQITKNPFRLHSTTHRATLLVEPVAPVTNHFTVWERKDNPNMAHAFPCNSDGFIIVAKLSNEAKTNFINIAKHSDKYKETGVHEVQSGGLPMVFVCTCGTITKFLGWKEPETTCLGCYTLWSWLDVLNLPKAKSEIIHE